MRPGSIHTHPPSGDRFPCRSRSWPPPSQANAPTPIPRSSIRWGFWTRDGGRTFNPHVQRETRKPPDGTTFCGPDRSPPKQTATYSRTTRRRWTTHKSGVVIRPMSANPPRLKQRPFRTETLKSALRPLVGVFFRSRYSSPSVRFLSFGGRWCLPCGRVAEGVFRSPGLAAKESAGFLGILGAWRRFLSHMVDRLSVWIRRVPPPWPSSRSCSMMRL